MTTAVTAQPRIDAGPMSAFRHRVSSQGSEKSWRDDVEILFYSGSILTASKRQSAALYIASARNLTKKPVCFSFTFRSPEGETWGSGDVYYLKGRQTLRNFAGAHAMGYYDDEVHTVGMNQREIKSWEPVNGRC